MTLLNDVSTNEVVQNDTNSSSAANIEQYTNYAQYLNLLLTPFGDKYPKLVGAYGVLSGQTGVVGSGADLTQKTHNDSASHTDVLDIVGAASTIVAGVALMAGKNSLSLVSSAVGIGITAYNYMDSNDWDFDKVTSDVKKAMNYLESKNYYKDSLLVDDITDFYSSIVDGRMFDYYKNKTSDEILSDAKDFFVASGELVADILDEGGVSLSDALKGLLGFNEKEADKQNQDGEKINFDGLKNDENIENKDDEQMGKIPEQIEQNKEEQNNNTTNGSAANIVELAKQNVSLYNQNINKGYDDIMSFLFA